MSDQEKNNIPENEGNMETNPEKDLVVFEDDDGNEYTFEPLDYFFYNGEEYALLTEITDGDEEDERVEVIVCRVTSDTDENGEETESFELVEDEELAGKLVEIANTRLTEDEEEE